MSRYQSLDTGAGQALAQGFGLGLERRRLDQDAVGLGLERRRLDQDAEQHAAELQRRRMLDAFLQEMDRGRLTLDRQRFEGGMEIDRGSLDLRREEFEEQRRERLAKALTAARRRAGLLTALRGAGAASSGGAGGAGGAGGMAGAMGGGGRGGPVDPSTGGTIGMDDARAPYGDTGGVGAPEMGGMGGGLLGGGAAMVDDPFAGLPLEELDDQTLEEAVRMQMADQFRRTQEQRQYERDQTAAFAVIDHFRAMGKDDRFINRVIRARLGKRADAFMLPEEPDPALLAAAESGDARAYGMAQLRGGGELSSTMEGAMFDSSGAVTPEEFEQRVADILTKNPHWSRAQAEAHVRLAEDKMTNQVPAGIGGDLDVAKLPRMKILELDLADAETELRSLEKQFDSLNREGERTKFAPRLDAARRKASGIRQQMRRLWEDAERRGPRQQAPAQTAPAAAEPEQADFDAAAAELGPEATDDQILARARELRGARP